MLEGWGAPSPTEIELSVFGRGHGESIVLHVGDGNWIVVDSLRDSDKACVPLKYLEHLGVNIAQKVRLVAASHWHDDHIKGLSDMYRAASSSEFAMPLAMFRPSFEQFVKNYKDVDVAGFSSGVRELGAIIRELKARAGVVTWCNSWKTIFKTNGGELSHGLPVEIQAISPSDYDVTKFLARIGADKAATVAKRAPRFPENDVSVAMWVAIGEARILLGADLENKGNARSGWKAVIEAPQCPQKPAQIMKIAHHGALSGHHPDVWSKMCIPEVTASLAPWANGGNRLPTPDDVNRILGKTPNGYSTNQSPMAAGKPRPTLVGSYVNDHGAKLRAYNLNLGHVRHRFDCASGTPAWATDMLGQACRLNAVNH